MNPKILALLLSTVSFPAWAADTCTAPPADSKFHPGDHVQTTHQTNVRNSAALNATLLGSQPTGAKGTLVCGPLASTTDAYTWWNINYDSGVDGYSGEDNLQLADNTPVPPIPPVTGTCSPPNYSAWLS